MEIRDPAIVPSGRAILAGWIQYGWVRERRWVQASQSPERRMNILILGGTGFLGPHIVESAKKRKHTITLFNRGKTNPSLFPELERLRGDRNGDLKALEGRKWDA